MPDDMPIRRFYMLLPRLANSVLYRIVVYFALPCTMRHDAACAVLSRKAFAAMARRCLDGLSFTGFSRFHPVFLPETALPAACR